MNAREVAELNGQLAMALKAARAAGAVGSDDELTNAILISTAPTRSTSDRC